MAPITTAGAAVVPPSPPALMPSGLGGAEHLGDLGLERGHGVGARHAVIHQRADQRLAAVALDVALLPHGLTDALRDRAVGLPVHDQWIDTAADVVDRGVAGDAYRAGLGIDLDLAYGAAIRENRIVHLVVRHHADAVRDIRREIVGQILSHGLPAPARGNRS